MIKQCPQCGSIDPCGPFHRKQFILHAAEVQIEMYLKKARELVEAGEVCVASELCYASISSIALNTPKLLSLGETQPEPQDKET